MSSDVLIDYAPAMAAGNGFGYRGETEVEEMFLNDTDGNQP